MFHLAKIPQEICQNILKMYLTAAITGKIILVSDPAYCNYFYLYKERIRQIPVTKHLIHSTETVTFCLADHAS
jgi:hypothetical protein